MKRRHQGVRLRAIAVAGAIALAGAGLPLLAGPAAAQDAPSGSSALPSITDALPDLPSGSLTPGPSDIPDLPIPGLPGGKRSGDPAMDLSKSTGLADGETITVTGTGYRPDDGVYIAQTIERPKAGFPQTYGEAVKVTPDEDGSFTAKLPVNVVFGEVDCRKTDCYVGSFTAFPNLVDRSQDVWKPISFAAGAKPAAGTGAAGAGDSGPAAAGGARGDSATSTSSSGARVTVRPVSGLTPAGDTVRVVGRGFKTAGNGIYVGLVDVARFSPINRDAFAPGTVWVARNNNKLKEDGSFAIDLPVQARFNDTDCTKVECAVYTFAAHGSPDRSQDTSTPVTFAAGPAGAGDSGGGAGSGTGADSDAGTDSGASGASGTGTASNTSGVSVSATPTTGLNPAGDTVTVSGSGFKTGEPGIYVGIAADDNFSPTNQDAFGPDTIWVAEKNGRMSSDGSFTVSLPVQAKFGSTDCLTQRCSIFTFAAHGSSDRSQDTATPVGFTGGVAPGASGGTPTAKAGSDGASGGNYAAADSGDDADSASSADGSPSVSASPTTIAAKGSTPVTVSGSGFSTDGPGIYVGVAEKSKFSHVDASVFGAVEFIRASEMGSDGSWSTTLDISPVFPSGNCIDNQCAIFTFAAHGSSDRSQDTATDITVSGSEKEKEEARKAAEEGKDKADKEGKDKAGIAGSDDAADAEVDRTAASSGLGHFGFGLLGFILGGIVVFLLGATRRKRDREQPTA
ncbi:neocarzinostatin apoprotein domain-containing protein [Corynebacterium sphenisci]|uniref:neocarzinostatin apoprotein domain-containing protein n=1 Tax=Corynebacterium sphenisci TaxID=191493 RepID=UPI0026E095FA|nr:neocarzinostatin apoprotein domain-containing protein [Corynebacterium sphenisci]MDO5731756.1 neocarzinostatin apoprotein domain-containing protein [Corynebacterium sphenisci]